MALVAEDLKEAMKAKLKNVSDPSKAMDALWEGVSEYVSQNAQVTFTWVGVDPSLASDPIVSFTGTIDTGTVVKGSAAKTITLDTIDVAEAATVVSEAKKAANAAALAKIEEAAEEDDGIETKEIDLSENKDKEKTTLKNEEEDETTWGMVEYHGIGESVTIQRSGEWILEDDEISGEPQYRHIKSGPMIRTWIYPTQPREYSYLNILCGFFLRVGYGTNSKVNLNEEKYKKQPNFWDGDARVTLPKEINHLWFGQLDQIGLTSDQVKDVTDIEKARLSQIFVDSIDGKEHDLTDTFWSISDFTIYPVRGLDDLSNDYYRTSFFLIRPKKFITYDEFCTKSHGDTLHWYQLHLGKGLFTFDLDGYKSDYYAYTALDWTLFPPDVEITDEINTKFNIPENYKYTEDYYRKLYNESYNHFVKEYENPIFNTLPYSIIDLSMYKKDGKWTKDTILRNGLIFAVEPSPYVTDFEIDFTKHAGFYGNGHGFWNEEGGHWMEGDGELEIKPLDPITINNKTYKYVFRVIVIPEVEDIPEFKEEENTEGGYYFYEEEFERNFNTFPFSTYGNDTENPWEEPLRDDFNGKDSTVSGCLFGSDREYLEVILPLRFVKATDIFSGEPLDMIAYCLQRVHYVELVGLFDNSYYNSDIDNFYANYTNDPEYEDAESRYSKKFGHYFNSDSPLRCNTIKKLYKEKLCQVSTKTMEITKKNKYLLVEDTEGQGDVSGGESPNGNVFPSDIDPNPEQLPTPSVPTLALSMATTTAAAMSNLSDQMNSRAAKWVVRPPADFTLTPFLVIPSITLDSSGSTDRDSAFLKMAQDIIDGIKVSTPTGTGSHAAFVGTATFTQII